MSVPVAALIEPAMDGDAVGDGEVGAAVGAAVGRCPPLHVTLTATSNESFGSQLRWTAILCGPSPAGTDLALYPHQS